MANQASYVGPAFADNTSEYALQQRQLEARKAQAAKLVQDAMQSNGGSGMAGGVYMVGNQYGNLAKSLGGSLMSALADRDQQNLVQQQGQAQREFNEAYRNAPDDATRQNLLVDAQGKGLRTDLHQAFLKAEQAQNEAAAKAELDRIARREDLAIKLGSDAEMKREHDAAQLKLRETPIVQRFEGGARGAGGSTADIDRQIKEERLRQMREGKPPAADKPLTEAQGNAYLFGTRADAAHRILDEVGTKYSPMKVSIAGAVEKVPGVNVGANALLPDNEQKVFQAQRDFVNAVLRKESGAAIAQSEFDNARRQYFPQPGDSAAVIEQKRANRETAIKGLAKIVGPQGAGIGKPAQAPAVAPGTKGMHKGKPVVMGTDGEWHYE